MTNFLTKRHSKPVPYHHSIFFPGNFLFVVKKNEKRANRIEDLFLVVIIPVDPNVLF
jgi:hypothetical protein